MGSRPHYLAGRHHFHRNGIMNSKYIGRDRITFFTKFHFAFRELLLAQLNVTTSPAMPALPNHQCGVRCRASGRKRRSAGRTSTTTFGGRPSGHRPLNRHRLRSSPSNASTPNRLNFTTTAELTYIALAWRSACHHRHHAVGVAFFILL